MLGSAEKHALVGKWRSDPADTEAINAYGDVTLDFLSDGGLTYTIRAEGKRQIILLTYRVEGDAIDNRSTVGSEGRTNSIRNHSPRRARSPVR